MAYMHKETFGIERSRHESEDNYFEVDELIALPIQILNRKGYFTHACCSGHPFAVSDDKFLADLGKLNTASANFTKKDLLGYRSVIVFKEGVSLSSLPPGFVLCDYNYLLEVVRYTEYTEPLAEGDLVEKMPDAEYFEKLAQDKKIIIHKLYDDNDVYGFLRDNLETMELLYKWTLELPDLKG